MNSKSREAIAKPSKAQPAGFRCGAEGNKAVKYKQCRALQTIGFSPTLSIPDQIPTLESRIRHPECLSMQQAVSIIRHHTEEK